MSLTDTSESTAAADPDPAGPPAGTSAAKPSKKRTAFAVGLLAACVGAGVWIGLGSIHHAKPIRSSDVEACTLLSTADVDRLVGPLSAVPHPKGQDVKVTQHTSGSRHRFGHDYTTTENVKNYDTCVYLPDAGALKYVQTTVVPLADAQLDLVFYYGDGHKKDGGLTYAPLKGVGDRAVIGSGPLYGTSHPQSVIYVQQGAWALEVQVIDEPDSVATELATTLASAPRLQQPPAARS